MVIWSDYLTNASTFLGVTPTQAGVMLSIAITLAMSLTILIATRGRKAEITIPLTLLLATILFTFMAWYPFWTGSVISLVLSIIVAKIISSGV